MFSVFLFPCVTVHEFPFYGGFGITRIYLQYVEYSGICYIYCMFCRVSHRFPSYGGKSGHSTGTSSCKSRCQHPGKHQNWTAGEIIASCITICFCIFLCYISGHPGMLYLFFVVIFYILFLFIGAQPVYIWTMWKVWNGSCFCIFYWPGLHSFPVIGGIAFSKYSRYKYTDSASEMDNCVKNY